MSKSAPEPDANDPLLAALRHLPLLPVDAPLDMRLKREARAAYLRSFEVSTWHGSAMPQVGRAVLPMLLAGVVGVYMTWAIVTATALVH